MDQSLISSYTIDISQLPAGFDRRPEENLPPSENNQRMLVISSIINVYQGLPCPAKKLGSKKIASIKYWKSNDSNTGFMVRVNSVEAAMFPIIDSEY